MLNPYMFSLSSYSYFIPIFCPEVYETKHVRYTAYCSIEANYIWRDILLILEMKMDVVTLNEAKINLEHLINQVISNAEPAIVVTDSGQRVVLMSLDEFNSWQETLYLLSNPANAEHLRKSIAEAEAGYIIEKDLIESGGWFSQSLLGKITSGCKKMTASSPLE